MAKKKKKGKGGGVLFQSYTGADPDFYAGKTRTEAKIGRKLTTAEYLKDYYKPPENPVACGTSIFDPVLCELMLSWHCPSGGVVIDPFAGGSVRGVVASTLGLNYHGVDLSERQVEENRAQAEKIGCNPVPTWYCGDSSNIDEILANVKADFIFSCPPYADLEVYSDDARDLSNMSYENFRTAYFEIVRKSCALLREDAFACFVVGEVRSKTGGYYGFVPDTVRAFEEAGLTYYNEAVLVTQIGNLAMRVGKQFEGSRKLGKTHQNILIFVKGDAKKAAQKCGPCVYSIDEELNDIEL